MKKIILTVLLCYLVNANSNYINAQPLQELRGVWITNVDSYVLNNDLAISKAMDYLASVGINVVFPVMWNQGYTLYPSTVMESRFGKPIWPTVAGRDPLERLVIEAHRNGIEVIPWMEYGFASSYSQNGGHLIKQYPSWAGKDRTGKLLTKNGFDWMSGINPDVQNFMISICTEIVDRYDVDGIQGDDRLPGMPVEGGYDSVSQAIYRSEHNGSNPPQDYFDLNWKRWRGNKLNEFFSRLRDSVKVRGENLIISAAPSVYPWGYDNYLQDSKTWVDSGIADNFIPQLYRDNFSSYSNELTLSLNYVPQSKKNIFFAGILGKVGSYVITPKLLKDCILENRRKNVKGETFFFYEAIANSNKYNGDTLRTTVYSKPALLPYRKGYNWRPKPEITNESDSLMVDVTGKWTVKVVPLWGYKPNVLMTNDSSYASISYDVNVPYDAWFDIFAFVEPNLVCANNVKYVVYSMSDSSVVTIDQSNVKKKGWTKIGQAYLTAGKRTIVKIDNSGIAKGKYVFADAVMAMINRKKSPDVIVTDIKPETGKAAVTPAEFRLYQNYPNPFNPTTTIRYDLPQAGNVTLKVFDILGKEAALLESGYKTAGSYNTAFNAAEFPSGVYFYQLSFNNRLISGKMLLLK